MADTKTEQEPSIEEILESIRQIISEDTDSGKKLATEENPLDISQATPPSPADVVQEPVVLAPVEQEPVPDSDFVPDPIPEPVSEPDSDLVLKPVPESVSADDSDLVLKPVSEPGPADDVDILDLVEKVNPEQAVEPEEPSLAKVEMVEKSVTDEAVTDEPVIEEPKAEEPAKDDLISAQTADVAVETLSKLLAGDIAIEDTGHVGKVTLEEMTRELMRPMIKSWIDQNLPGIVEKMVQKEIEKLSRLAMDR